MKTFFRYLGYRMKDSALRTVVISLLSFFFTMSMVDSSISLEQAYNTDTGRYDRNVVNCSLIFFYILLIILVYVIPMMELSRFKNRRNLDTLYFFPLDRIKLALVHYISGFLQFLAAYTLSFIVVALRILRIPDLHQIYLIPCYLGMLFSSLLVYTFVCYLFFSENTVFDGVVTSLWWIAVPTLVYTLPQTIFLDMISFSPSGFWYVLFGPMILLGEVFSACFKFGAGATGDAIEHFKDEWYMLLIWTALAGLAFFLYLRTFKKKGAEQAGAPFTSPVGLQLLIPAWGYLGLWFVFQIDAGILTFMSILSILIGYFILRRSFKLKKRDLICIALTITLAIAVSLSRPLMQKVIDRLAEDDEPSYTFVKEPNFDQVEPIVFLAGTDPAHYGATIERFSHYSDQKGNVDVYMELSFNTKREMMTYLEKLRANAQDESLPYLGLYEDPTEPIFEYTTLFSTKYTFKSIKTPTAGCLASFSGKDREEILLDCNYGVISYSTKTFTVIQSYCRGTFEASNGKNIPVLAQNYFLNGYEVSFKE